MNYGLPQVWCTSWVDTLVPALDNLAFAQCEFDRFSSGVAAVKYSAICQSSLSMHPSWPTREHTLIVESTDQSGRPYAVVYRHDISCFCFLLTITGLVLHKDIDFRRERAAVAVQRCAFTLTPIWSLVTSLAAVTQYRLASAVKHTSTKSFDIPTACAQIVMPNGAMLSTAVCLCVLQLQLQP